MYEKPLVSRALPVSFPPFWLPRDTKSDSNLHWRQAKHAFGDGSFMSRLDLQKLTLLLALLAGLLTFGNSFFAGYSSQRD